MKNAVITDRGFQYDRRWLLVDEYNMFLTQRQIPAASLLAVALDKDGMLVTRKTSGGSIYIPYKPQTGEFCEVNIWDDVCKAVYVSAEADEWFTKVLGFKCRLVYMPDGSKRQVDQKYAPGDHITSFSDGYPILIIGQASLDDLNSRLAQPVPMNRFRPNIVFTGGKPYEEDLMDNFTIAGINFRGVKLCSRCIITTIDQTDASRSKEPLKTLATYRAKNNNIYFGQNLVQQGNGVVSIGDAINVASYHHNERFTI